MRGRDVIGLVFLGVFLTLSVGAYLWWEYGRTEEEPAATKQATSSQTVQQVAGLQTTQPSQGNGSTLQVQGASNVTLPGQEQASQTAPPSSQPPQPALPGPEQFTEYEQFADGQLRYLDIVEGDGIEASAGMQAALLYQGWLTDGTLFDRTQPDENGVEQPFVFELGAGQVIRGWEQGVSGMKVGGKRRLVIPHELAYGSTGQGPIPPNAMLIFDVELVSAR